MKNIYKAILASVTAFLAACYNDASVDQGVSGATTEPSTSPIAKLTDEQKAFLARSFFTLVDSTKVDSLKAVLDFDSIGNYGYFLHYHDYFNTTPNKVKNDQIFSYPSKDDRKVCDVVTYTQLDRKDQKGVLQARSYDIHDHDCRYSEEECADDYLANHRNETIINTKIVDVDGVPVVLNTVENSLYAGFYGYGVSCLDYLNQFKYSCSALNGLFVDFRDGCSDNTLNVACASFVPEEKSLDDFLNSYIEKYKNQCLDDSIKYAPFDDENYVYVDPYSDSLYKDSVRTVSILRREWGDSIKHIMEAYRWQFTIIDSTIGVDESDHFVYEEREYREIGRDWGLAYNTLPDTKIADDYRKEGVYVLPDSLVEAFFPTVATYPGGLESFKWNPPEIFYIIVIKDVGAKGHLVSKTDESGIYVTDIVKSGNCPEDTSVHYFTILTVASPYWDVLDRPIVKKTYVSDKWNCDKPESLERIEPYGEWTYTLRSRHYEEWFETFEKDRLLELYGGKERYIEIYDEEQYISIYGED